MTLRPFDLLVLDFDGTLVDSRDLLVGLVNDVLAARGHARADTTLIAGRIGLPLDEVFRRALGAAAPAAAVADLCTHYRARANRDEFVRKFRLYPDVAPTLAALQAAGLRLVVGTSKGRETTLDIARHCGIDGLLDEVIGGDCVTSGKPHPEMVERARERFGAAPARTLVVGDTSFDITMGQAAGAATCAVTYGMHSADALRRLAPSFVIDEFPELLALAGCGSD